MSLQTKILKDYRDQFPQHTLRETAHHTGLQLTRVFRLMNGASMRLDEFEIFSQVIGQNSLGRYQDTALQKSILEAQKILPDHQLNKLTALVERHLHWHQLAHGDELKNTFDQNIA